MTSLITQAGFPEEVQNLVHRLSHLRVARPEHLLAGGEGIAAW